MRHGGIWWVCRSRSYKDKATAESIANDLNADHLRMLVQDLKEAQEGTPKKTRGITKRTKIDAFLRDFFSKWSRWPPIDDIATQFDVSDRYAQTLIMEMRQELGR